MAFWGLYDGMDMPPKKNNEPKPVNDEHLDTDPVNESAAKKRRVDVAPGLIPRVAQAKKLGHAIPRNLQKKPVAFAVQSKPSPNSASKLKPLFSTNEESSSNSTISNSSSTTATKTTTSIISRKPLASVSASPLALFSEDVSPHELTLDGPDSASPLESHASIMKALQAIEDLYDPSNPNKYHDLVAELDRKKEEERQMEFKEMMDRSMHKGGMGASPYSSYAQHEPDEDKVILSGVSSLLYDSMETEPTAPKPPSALPESTLMPPPPPKPKKVAPSPASKPSTPIAPLSPQVSEPTKAPEPLPVDDDDDIDGVPIDLSQLANLESPPVISEPMPPPPKSAKKKNKPAKKLSIAEQMMKKMGWKGAGHGLGKNQQGIAEPIIMQATGVAGQGIIIGPRLTSAPLVTMPDTCVIILTNMVGPGEVDDLLLAETAGECQKYGRVVECEIRETPNVAPEVAVQIFIKFSHKDEAFKALADLDGRIFAGRAVRADPFDQDKFDRRDFTSGGILTA